MFRFAGKVIKLSLIILFTIVEEIGKMVNNIAAAALEEVGTWDFNRKEKEPRVKEEKQEVQEKTTYTAEEVNKMLKSGKARVA